MSLSQTQINEIFTAMGLPQPSSALAASLEAIPDNYVALNTIIDLPQVQTEVIPILAMFDLALGHDPTSATLSSMVENNGGNIPSIANQFVESQAFANVYNNGTLLSANTVIDASNSEIITALFVNGLHHPPTAATLQGFFGLTLGQAFLEFTQSDAIAATDNASLLNILELAAGIPPQAAPVVTQTFTLTLGANEVVSGENTIGTTTPGVAVQSSGNVTVDALLAPAFVGSNVLVPTLNSGDIINLAGTGNVLNAQIFGGTGTGISGAENIVNVDIQGVQTWNIAEENPNGGTTNITGDILVAGGTTFTDPVLQGLTSLTFSDSSTTGSLNIGTNQEPVYLAPGATGPFNFSVTVISAVGNGSNGVDVDFAGAAFTTPGSTIHVDAESVGGFAVDSGGTTIIPNPILGTTGDPDNYDPNWKGFYQDSYSISAGSSSGGPSGTAIGFTNWVVNSSAASAVGGLNIIALGGEGSTSATSLTLTDDGSNTMLFASFQSDSLGGHDWQNLKNINLAGTSGFVTLTGLEASIADGYTPGSTNYSGDIGLLANLIGPINIQFNGTGNSFYDLTALSFTAAAGSIIEGGSNTQFLDTTSSILPGYSEVAFNNNVWTENGASEGGSTVIALSNISVGDDASATQGGSINMANFPLTPLAQPYALIAEGNPPAGTVPFGLPYTYASTPIPASLNSDYSNLGAFLTEGVIPAGFPVLQLLNAEGSTAVALTSNLDILNAPKNFAINMQDVSNPDFYNVSVTGVSQAQNLVLFVSDGGSPDGPFDVQPGGENEGGEPNVFSIPVLTIENYQNVNIVLPSEQAGDGNDVGLGTSGFIVAPSDAELTTTVNFYDNVADTGGSPASEDNLYLGQTQTYSVELANDPFLPSCFVPMYGDPTQAGLIGHATVVIEVNLGFATPPEAIINDFGTGRFEIGATDATNINAQSTGQTDVGGLIMDLPATYFGAFGATVGSSDSSGENLFFETIGNENGQANLGVTVNGSVHDANLLQGSSGPIQHDLAAIYDPYYNNDAYYGAVGNDVLTGGAYGDNYFPEGGNDVINLAHATSADAASGALPASSTIWFGFYNVGYSGTQETGTTPGAVLEQAITDFSYSSTGEQFVDGYGSSLLTINNFNFNPGGDQINFGTSDWANNINGGYGQWLEGLVQWDATTNVSGGSPHSPTPATYYTVGTAADNNSAFAVSSGTDVVLDNIGGGFASAANLQAALLNDGGGDIYFSGNGLAGYHTADLLIAYQNSTTHEIDIADVTIYNGTNNTIHDTAFASSLTVTNLISIPIPTTGLVGVANLIGHLDFVHA